MVNVANEQHEDNLPPNELVYWGTETTEKTHLNSAM